MKTKLFLAGGVAALAFVAKLAYQKFFNKHEVLSRQVIIKKLIDTKEYLYPILFQIAEVVETRLVPKGVSPEQAKLFIIESEQRNYRLKIVAFKQNILNILMQKVYFDIKQQDLQYDIQNTYRQDTQIQFYRKQFEEQYEKCFLGIKPEPLLTRLIIINKQTVLQITRSLLLSNLFLMADKIARLTIIVQQCKLFSQGIYVQEIEKRLIKSQKDDDIVRIELLKSHNITDDKLFQFALGKLIKQSKQFKLEYQQLLRVYKQSLQNTMSLNKNKTIPIKQGQN